MKLEPGLKLRLLVDPVHAGIRWVGGILKISPEVGLSRQPNRCSRVDLPGGFTGDGKKLFSGKTRFNPSAPPVFFTGLIGFIQFLHCSRPLCHGHSLSDSD